MPQAVPAILIAAGQAIATGFTVKLFVGFVVNVALGGLTHTDADGVRWVALKRS